MSPPAEYPSNLFPPCRLAGILRGLSGYYYKEPTLLFLVRIAQGLVHMGKGLLTLNPYHSDHVLLSGGLAPQPGAPLGALPVLVGAFSLKGAGWLPFLVGRSFRGLPLVDPFGYVSVWGHLQVLCWRAGFWCCCPAWALTKCSYMQSRY